MIPIIFCAIEKKKNQNLTAKEYIDAMKGGVGF